LIGIRNFQKNGKWLEGAGCMSKKEFELRKWIKELLGVSLSWIEPARGGSVGMADALVSLPDKRKLPVELKHWDVDSKGGWICEMRPAQIRYHFMTHYRSLGKTAICFLINDQVYVVDGQFVPKHKKNHNVVLFAKYVCKLDDKSQSAKIKLINLLWGI
jgi:hypothetical protein